jgi:transcriptional regulator GlxA family with amidase domain
MCMHDGQEMRQVAPSALTLMAEGDRPLIVSVVVADGLVSSFGLGVAAEVFGRDRRDIGLPQFDFGLVAEQPGVVRTDTGIPLTVDHGLKRLAQSDLVITITAWELFDRVPSRQLLDAVRAAHVRGALIVSQCTGAFVLAAAGLLDGQRVTTHWKYAGELAARYPAVEVDPMVLYVDNGQIITGAGTAAGIDTLLHVVRREWGAAVANALAREMVVPGHRDGGQAQFVDAPVPACEDELLGTALDWASAHLAEDIRVETLARRALMSPRSFARRFRAMSGTTPYAWLLGQRLATAEKLLENSDTPVEEIARLVGFGTAGGMRQQFIRRRGISPRAYRRTFRGTAVERAHHRAARSGPSSGRDEGGPVLPARHPPG